MKKKTVKATKRKSLIGQIFKLIKSLFKLAFFPITFTFKLLRYVFRFIHKHCWAPIKVKLDILAEKRRIAREIVKLDKKNKDNCAKELVEVLGGLDNIISLKSGIRAIYIKVELEFLVELDELKKFGFVWYELEKGCLTLTLGFQVSWICKVIKQYIQITRKPRIRKHSQVARKKLTFKDVVKKIGDAVIKTKDALLNLRTTLIELKDKAIALYEKKKEEFAEWYAKKKEEFRLWKIKRAEERKKRKLERAKQRKAKKLMMAARKKQKMQMQKQKQMRQAALRKQKAAARAQQAKAKQAARKAKAQSQKAKQKRPSPGKKPQQRKRR